MIPRKFRVSAREFVGGVGVLLKSPLFTIKTKPNQRAYNRYAIVIGANVVKRAVDRHALKRMVLSRAVKLPAAGTDYLFITKSHPSRRALEEEFRKLEQSNGEYIARTI